jgi:hypothetical protein
MASANQTVGPQGGEYEADATEHTITFTVPGGYRARATTNVDTILDFNNQSISSVSAPVGAERARLILGQAPVNIPEDCAALMFKATASAMFQIERQ